MNRCRINPVRPYSRQARSGFTLVEVLAAMTVVVLILAMLGEIANNTMRATSASQRQLEATGEGRAVLDTLREDLANLVVENDLATVFAKVDGTNSKLLFVTRRRGPQGMADLRFLAVSYELDGTNLKRNVSRIGWSDVDLLSKAFQAPAPAMSGVLATGILRFEVVAQLDTGEAVPLQEAGLWRKTDWNGDPVPDGYSALCLGKGKADPSAPKVRALTVAVASVNEPSLLLPNTAGLAAALSASAAGQTPQEAWMAVIDGGGLKAFSPPAVAALRVLQRTYSFQ